MQGPFKGVASSLTRAFGGIVTLHPGTAQAVDVVAIFRMVPRLVDGTSGVEVETLVPSLRGSKADLTDLAEGVMVDPKDGGVYRALFPEQSASPASDALINWQLEVVL